MHQSVVSHAVGRGQWPAWAQVNNAVRMERVFMSTITIQYWFVCQCEAFRSSWQGLVGTMIGLVFRFQTSCSSSRASSSKLGAFINLWMASASISKVSR